MRLLITIPTCLKFAGTPQGFGLRGSGDFVIGDTQRSEISGFNYPETNLKVAPHYQWEDNYEVGNGQLALRKLNKLWGRCFLTNIST